MKEISLSIDTVAALGPDPGYRFFQKALRASVEGQLLYDELVRQGLEPQPERSQMFSTFSNDSLQSIAISVTPFTSGDQTREGGLSLSQGGHAQAVIVDIADRTRITGFTHLAVADGQVTFSQHDVGELRVGGPTMAAADDHLMAMAEQAGRVRAARPLVEIDARQVRSLASVSYNRLLDDQFSRSVHDEQEISVLRASTGVINEIGLFVLFRTSGSACCSCSCSCWGSSSCSCSYVG